MLAGDQLRQIVALLRVAAVAADLVDAEIRMRAVGQADRAGGAADLLHGHAVREIAEAGAAELLLDGDAVQAELAELRPQIAREACCCGRSRRRAARSRAAAKLRTVSRSMSAVSPRPKLKPPRPPASMG